MRRLAVVSVTALMLVGLGDASAFAATHAIKEHAPKKPVAQASSPGSPGIKPGTKAKERADASALEQAKKHHDGSMPRHKRHTQPSSTATPASTPTP